MTHKDAVRRVLTSPGLWALLMCWVLVAIVYVTHGRNPLAFVLIGRRFAEGDMVGNVGYDGQFAYYIASDPLGAPGHLDDPSYRYQRVLYPFLARLLALGIPSLIPWTLIGVNVVSISLGAHLTGRLLERGELNPLLALLLPLWIGQLFALRADLNEPLCFCLVVVALWFYTRKRYGPSAAALAAGALAKEAALLFLPGLVLAWLWRRRWRLALRYALVALLPYLAGGALFLDGTVGLSR